MSTMNNFRISYAFKMKEAREKYRIKSLVKTGCITLGVIYALVTLVFCIILLFGDLGALSLPVSMLMSFFITLIYGGMFTGVVVGIYYLISHFALNDRLFETNKYFVFERNFMELQRRNLLLHEEEYKAYLEHIKA